MSDYRDNVINIIRNLGQAGNISNVTHCMTRLRVVVKDETMVDEASLKDLEDVLGIVHDRPYSYEIIVGPGKCRQYADICADMGLADNGKEDTGLQFQEEWKKNKEELKSRQKGNRIRSAFKTVGDIFIPMIPGVIAAGLCTGFAALISQLIPGYADIKVWAVIYNVFSLIGTALMAYITAWVGYRAAERFGATPILGGILGMITSLDGINTISQQLGLYNDDVPLASVLRSGKGGVLAVIFGVLLLSVVEKKIRSIMPDALDIVFSPLLTILICVVPYILIIMPLLGYVSTGIVWVFGKLCLNQNVIVRIITGYISAALFLPMVATGMHHGLVALYSVQLQSLGYITLFPSLAMAGAGQVGAAIAIRIKAKRAGNNRLCSVIDGALPAGFLGIGEPLIYGVTLPLGRPFITAGIGAGFGGAFVMALEVAATTWGTSGILAAFVMTAGPGGAVRSVLSYLAGLLISYFFSFVITFFTINEKQLVSEASASDTKSEELSKYRQVSHGEIISFDPISNPFVYTITDEVGIHARPAGGLAALAKGYKSEITIEADGRKANGESLSELMNLGAVKGTELTVYAKGPDELEALAAIKIYLEENL